MTSVRERRISYDELKVLVFPCQRCGVEYAVDITRQEHRDGLDGPPLLCPFCRQPFDSRFRESLRTFAVWYTTVQESGQPCFFRLQEPDTQ